MGVEAVEFRIYSPEFRTSLRVGAPGTDCHGAWGMLLGCLGAAPTGQASGCE